MSTPPPDNPFAILVSGFSDSIAKHMALPRYEKNLARAAGGAFILTGCAYWAAWSKVLVGRDLGSLVAEAMSAHDVSLAFIVWSGFVAFGTLWLLAGLAGARSGQRDVMAAFYAALIAAACGLALFVLPELRVRPDPADIVVRGFFSACLASRIVRCWLTLRGSGGNAFRLVNKQLSRRNAPLRAARRPWWRLWW